MLLFNKKRMNKNRAAITQTKRIILKKKRKTRKFSNLKKKRKTRKFSILKKKRKMRKLSKMNKKKRKTRKFSKMNKKKLT